MSPLVIRVGSVTFRHVSSVKSGWKDVEDAIRTGKV